MPSTFDAHVGVAGTPAEWRTGSADISLSLSSYDALNLARQTGWAAKDIEAPGSARLDIAAKGIPAQGLDASIKGNFAGIDLSAAGKLVLAAEFAAEIQRDLQGRFGQSRPDRQDDRPRYSATPLRGLPSRSTARPWRSGPSVELQWDKGAVAGREIGGRVTVATAANGSPASTAIFRSIRSISAG